MVRPKLFRQLAVPLAILTEIVLNHFSYWTVGAVNHAGQYIFFIAPHLLFSGLFWLGGYRTFAVRFFWAIFVLIAGTKTYDFIGLAQIRWEISRLKSHIEEFRDEHGRLPKDFTEVGFEFVSSYAENRFQGYNLNRQYGYIFYFNAPSPSVCYSYSGNGQLYYDDD
jgi:hypothetical protein